LESGDLRPLRERVQRVKPGEKLVCVRGENAVGHAAAVEPTPFGDSQGGLRLAGISKNVS